MNCLKIKQKKLKGELYVSKRCPKYIEIDEQRIMQILLNLLSNSIKFTEIGYIKVYIHWYENESLDNITKPHLTFDTPPIDKDLKSSQKSYKNIDITDQLLKESLEILQMQEFIIRGADEKYFLDEHRSLKSISPRRNICMENNEFHLIGRDKPDVASILNERFIEHSTKLCSSNMSGILKFEIIDSGCGISLESQEKIFEPFEQEDGSVTRKYGGTGLGLFIIKKIVNKMDGIIKLYSQKNFGSNFIVAVPCKKSSEKLINMKFGSEIFNTTVTYKMKRALVVDDNPFNLKLINDYLEKMNITAILCLNGNEAYSKFTEHQLGYYSFITLDIQMPEIDGISTAKLIRTYEKSTIRMDNKSHTPIIFISGNSCEEEKEECLDPIGLIRADFFFKKPVKFKDFQNIVFKILKKQNI